MTARVYCLFSAVLLCLSACLSTTDAGAAVSGQCLPTLTVVSSRKECTSDRPCSGRHKCCCFDCGPVCVSPVFMKPAAKPPVKPGAEPPKPPVKPAAEPPKPPVKPGAEPPKPPVKPPVKPAAEPPKPPVKPPVKPAAEPPELPVCGKSCPQPPHRGDGYGLGHGNGVGRGHGGHGRGHGNGVGRGHSGHGRGHGGHGRGRGHDDD